MTDRELMQMALDALEHHTEMTRHLVSTNETIKALRARLAQPEPEPAIDTAYQKGYADAMGWKTQNHLEHLPTREWQGLTDEEIDEKTDFRAMVRYFEAKLKEKNT